MFVDFGERMLFEQFRDLVHELQKVFEPYIERQSNPEEVARAFELFVMTSRYDRAAHLQSSSWQFFPLHNAKTGKEQNLPLKAMLSIYACFRMAKDELFTSAVAADLPLVRSIR